MRSGFSDVATGLLVVCALIVTAAVVRREFFVTPAAAAQPNSEPRPVENGEEIAAAGQRMGPAGAPVQIVEFSDFQCPFCATFSRTLRQLRAKYPDRVSVLYRHAPIDQLHPHARRAALAAECAGEQGRFEPYHDRLFAQQDSIGVKPWARFAAEAGVPDAAAFDQCVRDERLMARVARDADLARKTGIDVTPTIVIDGTLIPGTLSEAELEKWITGRDR
ncbi:DsbA family protein, partial [Longimicrobium sp.]|uniref:DsbA family protein n=1 Tax=Longimicrobium sp. TaxID=2029185 RepID=UPI002E36A20D